MNPEVIRIECLKLALAQNADYQSALQEAALFEAFILRGAPAPTDPKD